MTKISNKFYIVAFFLLFVISTAILLLANEAKPPVAARIGYLDVGILVLPAINFFRTYLGKKNLPQYDMSYQVSKYPFGLILVGMVVW